MDRSKREQFFVEINQYGKDGTKLNHNKKHLFECRFQFDELIHNNHVSRTADGEKFRDALHDSENQGFQIQHPVHMLLHVLF